MQVKSLFKIFGFVSIAILLLSLNACIPTKNIPEGKYLLVNQSISGNHDTDTEALEAFYKQKPNGKVFYLPIMPYLYAYKLGEKKYNKKRYKYEDQYQEAKILFEKKQNALQLQLDSVASLTSSYQKTTDSSKLTKKLQKVSIKRNEKLNKLQRRLEAGNWFMRSVGEKPTIYDSALAIQTKEQIKLFLNQNGYFRAMVETKVETQKKKLSLVYQVTEKKPYSLSKVEYIIEDSTVSALVLQDSAEFLLREGDIYQENKIEEERTRLNRFLNDNGYFNFGVSYIHFEVDTLKEPFQAELSVIVRNPPGKTGHKRHYLDEVVFETDVNIAKRRVMEDTVVNGIRYVEEKKRYSKRVLDQKIFVRKDSLYSLFYTEQTQRALARLDIFKFVNINYDTLGGKLKANIFTSPYEKYQYSLEGGLNVTQSLPGPFVSLSLKNRNTFGGCEILEVRGRFGIEAQAGVTNDSDQYNSQEYGGNISLSFPRILLPLGKRLKNKLSLNVPRTQLSLGYSFVDRPEYSRTNIQSALTYQWRHWNNTRFEVNLLNLGVVYTSRLSDAFNQRLQELAAQGNTLALSFDRSLVSSFVASYVQASDSYGTTLEKTHYFKGYVESGGNYLNLLDGTLLSNNNQIFGLRYYRFAKFSFDYRLALPMGETKEFVSRINMGVAKPYGEGQRGLPYEKYFFSGGSNSNRAWRPRRLGPGSYTPPVLANGAFDYSFEQGGEVIMEANAELRGHLFSFFDYAFFVDASNIWMTIEDPSRPGALFEAKDFWKEFAIGTGFGLRLDFSFLLIRFDLGIKMFNPALPVGERFVGDNLSLSAPFGAKGQSTLNIGVGYPF